MRAVLALCSAAAAARTGWQELDARPAYAFADYVAEYGRSYEGAEYERRSNVFAANLAEVRAHNADPSQSYKMGLNEFSDLTDGEFRSAVRGKKRTPIAAVPHPGFPAMELPKSVDWREKNVVTEVKDQKSCGSCWAFSATEALESAVAIATGKLFTLSPQQIVSCSPNPNQCGGSGGCDGSTEPLAFNYTKTAGITTEKSYPYKGRTGTCSKSKIAPVAGNTGYVELPPNNYTALMTAVATVGPISIGAAASWNKYDSGIFESSKCGYDMDHGINLVGYGTDAGKDYWLVRNSWGKSFGENGYIRIRRYGEGNEPCGMDNTPQDGDACKGDKTPRRYCGMCALLSSSAYPTGAHLIS